MTRNCAGSRPTRPTRARSWTVDSGPGHGVLNYFGDATVWWGLFLVSAEAWPGILTVLSPLAMTYFLVFRTGARLLEKEMAKRPGYREYMERTSGFPLPHPAAGRPDVGA